MLFERVVAVSNEIRKTRSRREKADALARLLREADPAVTELIVSYLAGVLPGGRAGIGYRALEGLPPSAISASLAVSEVDAALSSIAASTGPGSRERRQALLQELFGRATEDEQRFLVALLLGDLRQGALAGIMTDAVAAAAGVPVARIRRAAMVAGGLAPVAAAVRERGADALRDFRLTPLQPLQPMLAQSAEDVGAALGKTGEAAVEWKLDGARLQIHIAGGEVRAFTRNLADVTARLPEVTQTMAGLRLGTAIFDAEAIALRGDLRPYPFQVTMSRFGSSRGVEEQHREVPLSVFVFDCLHLEGADLIDQPQEARYAELTDVVPPELLVPRITTADAAVAEGFLADALDRGHEGVMIKALGAPYEAGRRGSAWIKVKRAKSLDLVVLAAEWGHGRRQGRLSNLHLGARDPGTGGFVMLGKTFKGMTDEMLAWQTEKLLELETERRGITVYVRPALVVEVAFDGLQRSTRYPGGVALRFARVKGYRTDKNPEDADEIATVRALFDAS